ncbi:MAG: helix-turn-helix transcriptional regulator [Candidatus Shapirobacteria bacterium]
MIVIIKMMDKTIFTREHKLLTKLLRQARIDAGLDQIQVAKLLKKTQSYVSKIESGQRRIDIIQLKEFARIYKKNINYFLDK